MCPASGERTSVIECTEAARDEEESLEAEGLAAAAPCSLDCPGLEEWMTGILDRSRVSECVPGLACDSSSISSMCSSASSSLSAFCTVVR
jgi:hypothetical protein